MLLEQMRLAAGRGRAVWIHTNRAVLFPYSSAVVRLRPDLPSLPVTPPKR